MSTFQDQVPAKLCARCRVLKFDDSEFDSFESYSANGEPYLDFETSDSKVLEFQLDYELDDSFPHLVALANGASSGCDFCAYLRELLLSDEVQCRLSDKILDLAQKELPVTIFLYYTWGTKLDTENKGLDSLIVGLYLDTRQFTTLGRTGDLEMDIVLSVGSVSDEKHAIPSSKCDSWLRLSPSAQTTHLDDKKLIWMKSHLRDCHEGSHTNKCNSPIGTMDARALPTRLVDVRGPTPRLVHGSEIMSNNKNNQGDLPRYAALSYCWGTAMDAKNQLKTEVASEAKMRNEIPLSSMTKTLVDAVQLAQALQIPYLWVDALCILQDDSGDWEREAIRMGQVYANAFVTFCALNPSCHSSFLQPLSSRIIIPFQSSIRSGINGAYALQYYRCSIGTLWVPDTLSDVVSSRWVERGWVHQEFVMSARLLVFGPSFLHFLCPSITSSEHEPSSDEMSQWQFLLRGVSTDPSELYDEWGVSIAPMYSDRSFSKEEDALPAISGLAKYFSDAMQDEYVVGLWRKDIVRGLMWSYNDSGRRPRNLHNILARYDCSDRYVSPSWSWVGRHFIDFDLYRRPGCTFRDFQPLHDITPIVDVLGQNPFGRISSAELKITSKTYNHPCTIEVDDHDPSSGRLRLRDGTSISCEFDWRVSSELPIGLKLLVLGVIDWAEMRLRDDWWEGASINEVAQKDFAQIPDHDVYGLLILASGQNGKFYRVGTFHSLSRKGGSIRILDDCETETISLI